MILGDYYYYMGSARGADRKQGVETVHEHADMIKRIRDEIAMTNNGKLMIRNIRDRQDRERVPDLVARGFLRYARFIEARDSVCLPNLNADPREANPIQRIGLSWLDDGPDYEGAILARQESDGYYD